MKNFTIAYDLDNSLVVAGVQKHFLKRSFCDWSEKEELNKILQSTLDEDQDISPWFCLSLEDNSKNHFLRAKQQVSLIYSKIIKIFIRIKKL